MLAFFHILSFYKQIYKIILPFYFNAHHPLPVTHQLSLCLSSFIMLYEISFINMEKE